jgi:hypothetical protein
MAWSTAGILTNPAIDTILADTGAVATTSGPVDIHVIVGGSVASIITIEHRNSTNTANISSQVVAFGANVAEEFDLKNIILAASERVRLRLNAAVTGSIQGSIFMF